MKKLLSVIVFLAGTSAFACGQQEAQFIGKVINLTKTTNGCTFEISFTMYNVSGVCPLDEGEVAGTKFADLNCSLKNGSPISGYLVKKDGGSVYIE